MSSSEEDRPPPPAKDPLLHDPAFAELVGPPPQVSPEPVFAEPVEAPVESLPVAEVIRPKAVPIPVAPAPKIAPKVTMPTPVQTEPPKPRWFAACSVIGCLGVLVIASVAALLFIAITLLSNLNDKLGDTKPTGRDLEKVPRGPLAPTRLEKDTELNLSGRVDAVARGGGGRFLLMRVSTRREILVFDANQGEIVHRLAEVGAPGMLLTAGADKVIICDTVDRKLKRYGLFSGVFEAEESLPKTLRVLAIAMGADSAGTVRLISDNGGKLRIHAFDTSTLKESGTAANFAAFNVDPNGALLARASDSGSVLGVSHADGAAAIWYGGGNVSSKNLAAPGSEKPRWAIPSPDGQYIYTPRGVYDSGGNPRSGNRSGFYTFPTAHGSDWFLSLDSSDGSVTGDPSRHAADETSMARGKTLENGSLSTDFPANRLEKNELTAADRVHYWPAAGLVAVLPYAAAEQTPKMQLFKVPVQVK